MVPLGPLAPTFVCSEVDHSRQAARVSVRREDLGLLYFLGSGGGQGLTEQYVTRRFEVGQAVHAPVEKGSCIVDRSVFTRHDDDAGKHFFFTEVIGYPDDCGLGDGFVDLKRCFDLGGRDVLARVGWASS